MICPQCGTLNENERDGCKRCNKPLHPAGMKGKIACVTHANREATTSCNQCGNRLCPACAFNVGGIDFCEDCAPAEAISQEHDEDYERLPVLPPEKAVPASFGSRLVALGIDTTIFLGLAILVGLIMLMFNGPFERLFSIRQGGPIFWTFWGITLLTAVVYSGIVVSMNGQTVGKKLMGVIVLAPDGHILPWQVSAKRAAASILSALPLGLGFWWALWDPKGETWHDKLAGTRAFRWEEVA